MYTLLIVFFLVSIIFSFLCSVWEAVLLSITPTFVQNQLQQKSKTGELLDSFKKNIDRPLAAILTLNTIAHTVGAIGVGAQATKIWGNTFMATIGTPVIMTLAILILSEIIPKTIGANNWRSLAGFTSKSISIIIKLLYPLVWLSQLITKSLKNDKNKSVLSRSDFSAIAQMAKKSGALAPGESQILENLIRFNEVEAKHVMTPRTVIMAAQESTTIGEFYKAHKNLRFSRIPIYQTSKDSISGYFLKDDLLQEMIDGNSDKQLSTIKREIIIANEGLNILRLFNKLLESSEHIALVVGEFGGTSGIVTMEDIIETLIGMEIVDEFDNTADMQLYARKKWEERAKKMDLQIENK